MKKYLILSFCAAAYLQFFCAETIQSKKLEELAKTVESFDYMLAQVQTSQDAELKKLFNQTFLESFDAVLEKFLPSAQSKCLRIFPAMTAKQIAQTLNLLVDILDKTWELYFEKNKDSSKPEFSRSKLNALIGECELYSNFIKTTKIDPATQKPTKFNNTQHDFPLVKILKIQPGKNAFHRLQAMTLDLLFVQMYSFVLRPTQGFMALKNFEKIKLKIERILPELYGTNYERYYKEKLKTANNFYATLTKELERLI